MDFQPQEVNRLVAYLLVIFVGIGIHEYAHAKVADMSGDDIPRLQGRVTLNLFKHFDPMGSLFIFISVLTGFGIGWGKPVMSDPRNMKNERWDHFATVAAGPFSNFIQACLFAIVFRTVIHVTPEIDPTSFGFWVLYYGVVANLSLALFNLIPLGPLDGHWLFGLLFLDNPARHNWFQFNRVYGAILLFVIILGGQFSGVSLVWMLLGPPVDAMTSILIGT
jgi:Zn-dependent protease